MTPEMVGRGGPAVDKGGSETVAAAADVGLLGFGKIGWEVRLGSDVGWAFAVRLRSDSAAGQGSEVVGLRFRLGLGMLFGLEPGLGWR